MPEYFEQIQDYVEGNLKGEELTAFEAALKSDTSLQDEVKLRREIQGILEHQEAASSEAEKLEFILQGKRESFFKGKKQKTGNLKRIRWGIGLAVAASIALILTFTGVFNATNYGQMPSMPEYAVRGEHTHETYNRAVTAFNDKNYDQAIVSLSALQEKEKENVSVNYFLGLSYLGKHNFEKAVKYLKKVAAGPSIYHEDARYFTGYTFYKLENEEEARVYLKMVPKGNAYFKKASRLMKKLE